MYTYEFTHTNNPILLSLQSRKPSEQKPQQAAYAWDEGAAFHIGNIEPVIGDGYTGKAPGNLYSPYELLGVGDETWEIETKGKPFMILFGIIWVIW